MALLLGAARTPIIVASVCVLPPGPLHSARYMSSFVISIAP